MRSLKDLTSLALKKKGSYFPFQKKNLQFVKSEQYFHSRLLLVCKYLFEISIFLVIDIISQTTSSFDFGTFWYKFTS